MIAFQSVTVDSNNSRPASSISWIVIAACAVLSAVLLFTSFPPAEIAAVAWIALIPLFYVLGEVRRPWQGGVVGLIYGMVFFGLFFYYISQYGVLPLVLLALFQGFFFAVFGWLAVYLQAVRSLLLRAAALAAAWVLVEYIRSHIGSLAVNFGDIAYSQYKLLSLLQIASMLGSGAVTLVVVFANALVASIFVQHHLERLETRRSTHPQIVKPVLVGLGLVFAVILGGAVVIQSGSFTSPAVRKIASGKPLQTVVVQGNVAIEHPPTQKDAERCRLTYVNMTSKSPGRMVADLIVWPETSLPVALNESPQYLDEVKQVAKQTGAYLLMGALEAAGAQVYNSAYLFSGEGKLLDTYRKVDLVMFGEYVPNLGPLNRLINRYPIRSQDIAPGTKRNLLQVYEVPIGTLICWEAIFAGPNRELCRKGAQLLVHITSDSWAAYSPELRQHGAIASVRAVESRRYVVRAATMGPSAIINPYGQPIPLYGQHIAEIKPGEEGAIDGKVYPLSGLSIYHRVGDLPLLIICAVLWVAAMFARHQP